MMYVPGGNCYEFEYEYIRVLMKIWKTAVCGKNNNMRRMIEGTRSALGLIYLPKSINAGRDILGLPLDGNNVIACMHN